LETPLAVFDRLIDTRKTQSLKSHFGASFGVPENVSAMHHHFFNETRPEKFEKMIPNFRTNEGKSGLIFRWWVAW